MGILFVIFVFIASFFGFGIVLAGAFTENPLKKMFVGLLLGFALAFGLVLVVLALIYTGCSHSSGGW
jgi:hypothetical protein